MSVPTTYRSVSNPVYSHYNPSPNSMHRKPANYSASNRSISPIPNVDHFPIPPTNKLQSPNTMTPLNSFPPRSVSPSITPPVTASTQQSATQPSYPSSISGNGVPAAEQLPPKSSLKPLTIQEIDAALEACLKVQELAVSEHSKRPFAAVLLGPDNSTVVTTHNSISHFRHAESELARLAATQYSPKYLEKCTLVSTWEPCSMCSGTVYWAGIGRVLYAAAETRLKELTGTNNEENMTMSLPCRVVFEAGQRKVEVIGPVSTWEQKVVESSGKWWKEHAVGQPPAVKTENIVKDNSSVSSHRTSVSIYNPNESYLGSIGEDGEYQADLKVDWMI